MTVKALIYLQTELFCHMQIPIITTTSMYLRQLQTHMVQ